MYIYNTIRKFLNLTITNKTNQYFKTVLKFIEFKATKFLPIN